MRIPLIAGLLGLALLASCGSTQLRHSVGVPSPMKASVPQVRPLQGRCIVVDAGHGGKDPGAHGVDGSDEKDVNLRMAFLVSSMLKVQGARVIMTRTGDQFLSLDERAQIADDTRCDLFLSIHADAATNPSARGATLFRARGALSESCEIGRNVLGALDRAGIAHRGLREAGFRVLMGHSRPSLLLECGFLTNSSDSALLADPRWCEQMAGAVCMGIRDALDA